MVQNTNIVYLLILVFAVVAVYIYGVNNRLVAPISILAGLTVAYYLWDKRENRESFYNGVDSPLEDGSGGVGGSAVKKESQEPEEKYHPNDILRKQEEWLKSIPPLRVEPNWEKTIEAPYEKKEASKARYGQPEHKYRGKAEMKLNIIMGKGEAQQAPGQPQNEITLWAEESAQIDYRGQWKTLEKFGYPMRAGYARSDTKDSGYRIRIDSWIQRAGKPNSNLALSNYTPPNQSYIPGQNSTYVTIMDQPDVKFDKRQIGKKLSSEKLPTSGWRLKEPTEWLNNYKLFVKLTGYTRENRDKKLMMRLNAADHPWGVVYDPIRNLNWGYRQVIRAEHGNLWTPRKRPLPLNRWVQGDGTGGKEVSLGKTNGHTACMNKVKSEHPDANGATYGVWGWRRGKCFAEYNMKDRKASSWYYNTMMFRPEGDNRYPGFVPRYNFSWAQRIGQSWRDTRSGGARWQVGKEYTQAFWVWWRESDRGWRTLWRGDYDHSIIVKSGSKQLGMYSNRSGGFRALNYNVDVYKWNLVIIVGRGGKDWNSSNRQKASIGTQEFWVANGGDGINNVGSTDRVISGTWTYRIGWPGQYPGCIAEAYHWNRRLTDKEIRTFYKSTAPKYYPELWKLVGVKEQNQLVYPGEQRRNWNWFVGAQRGPRTGRYGGVLDNTNLSGEIQKGKAPSVGASDTTKKSVSEYECRVLCDNDPKCFGFTTSGQTHFRGVAPRGKSDGSRAYGNYCWGHWRVRHWGEWWWGHAVWSRTRPYSWGGWSHFRCWWPGWFRWFWSGSTSHNQNFWPTWCTLHKDSSLSSLKREGKNDKSVAHTYRYEWDLPIINFNNQVLSRHGFIAKNEDAIFDVYMKINLPWGNEVYKMGRIITRKRFTWILTPWYPCKQPCGKSVKRRAPLCADFRDNKVLGTSQGFLPSKCGVCPNGKPSHLRLGKDNKKLGENSIFRKVCDNGKCPIQIDIRNIECDIIEIYKPKSVEGFTPQVVDMKTGKVIERFEEEEATAAEKAAQAEKEQNKTSADYYNQVAQADGSAGSGGAGTETEIDNANAEIQKSEGTEEEKGSEEETAAGVTEVKRAYEMPTDRKMGIHTGCYEQQQKEFAEKAKVPTFKNQLVYSGKDLLETRWKLIPAMSSGKYYTDLSNVLIYNPTHKVYLGWNDGDKATYVSSSVGEQNYWAVYQYPSELKCAIIHVLTNKYLNAIWAEAAGAPTFQCQVPEDSTIVPQKLYYGTLRCESELKTHWNVLPKKPTASSGGTSSARSAAAVCASQGKKLCSFSELNSYVNAGGYNNDKQRWTDARIWDNIGRPCWYTDQGISKEEANQFYNQMVKQKGIYTAQMMMDLGQGKIESFENPKNGPPTLKSFKEGSDIQMINSMFARKMNPQRPYGPGNWVYGKGKVIANKPEIEYDTKTSQGAVCCERTDSDCYIDNNLSAGKPINGSNLGLGKPLSRGHLGAAIHFNTIGRKNGAQWGCAKSKDYLDFNANVESEEKDIVNLGNIDFGGELWNIDDQWRRRIQNNESGGIGVTKIWPYFREALSTKPIGSHHVASIVNASGGSGENMMFSGTKNTETTIKIEAVSPDSYAGQTVLIRPN